jgi:phosphoglycolate phosphatase
VTTEQHHRHNAVIFDLDGTLIDSAPDVAEALNKSLESVQRSRLPLKTIRKFIGHGARNMIQDALEATGGLEIEVTLDGMIERYLSYYKNHIPLGICTNKPFVMAEIVLDQLNLAPYFCGMTAGDDVKHPKPDGRHITETLCRMGASKEGAVMVGDSESDLAAARDAGIGAVAVSYGYFSDSIDDRFIDMTIDTMTDLPSALQQLQKSS